MASNPPVQEPHAPLVAQDPVLPVVQQADLPQQEAPPVLQQNSGVQSQAAEDHAPAIPEVVHLQQQEAPVIQQNPGAQPQAVAAEGNRFAEVPGRPANVRRLVNTNSPETRFLRAMHRTLTRLNGEDSPRNIAQVRYTHPDGRAIHIYARSAGPNNPAIRVNPGGGVVESRCAEGFLTLAQQQNLAGIDLNGFVKQHVSSTNSPCNLCHQNNLEQNLTQDCQAPTPTYRAANYYGNSRRSHTGFQRRIRGRDQQADGDESDTEENEDRIQHFLIDEHQVAHRASGNNNPLPVIPLDFNEQQVPSGRRTLGLNVDTDAMRDYRQRNGELPPLAEVHAQNEVPRGRGRGRGGRGAPRGGRGRGGAHQEAEAVEAPVVVPQQQEGPQRGGIIRGRGRGGRGAPRGGRGGRGGAGRSHNDAME